jgi:hypothetical protein
VHVASGQVTSTRDSGGGPAGAQKDKGKVKGAQQITAQDGQTTEVLEPVRRVPEDQKLSWGKRDLNIEALTILSRKRALLETGKTQKQAPLHRVGKQRRP